MVVYVSGEGKLVTEKYMVNQQLVMHTYCTSWNVLITYNKMSTVIYHRYVSTSRGRSVYLLHVLLHNKIEMYTHYTTQKECILITYHGMYQKAVHGDHEMINPH